NAEIEKCVHQLVAPFAWPDQSDVAQIQWQQFLQRDEVTPVIVRFHNRGGPIVAFDRQKIWINHVADLPTQQFSERTQRPAIQAAPDNEKAERRMNFLHKIIFTQPCDGEMNSPRLQIAIDLGEEFFLTAFDKDINLAGATESSARVETHEDGFARLQNLS